MKKSYLLLLFVALCIACKVGAQTQGVQPCYSDQMTKRLHAMDPKILQAQKNYYQNQINESLKRIDFRKMPVTLDMDESGNPTFWYDIPVVVHVIHDFNAGLDYLTDDYIFQAVADWNVVYAKQNSDTADVISPFKKWVGNPRIRMHLASIDPNGNPTHGITRHRSYLAYYGNDQAKLDDWAPTSYVNIWSVNQIPASGGFQAAAYAYWPSEAVSIPFWDGVICFYSYIDEGGPTSIGSGNSYKTINHECGHVFNLEHPWGATNDPAVACGDDGVDDTPPTMGHNSPGCRYDLPRTNQNSIYDTACAENYWKIYTDAAGNDSLVNYPDTTNTQNIMDYTYCSKMFTIGQVARMHAALNSTLAGRSNLWDTANLVATGVLNADSTAFVPRIDLQPIPDFSVVNSTAVPPNNPNTGIPEYNTVYMSRVGYFTFPGATVYFNNETWNDTVTSLTWTFSNGASTPTATFTSFAHTSDNVIPNSFSQSGWVDLKMAATGNNTGTNTVDWPQAVYVADAAGTPAVGYFQEWQPNGDYQKWPSFNYYNNEFYWSIDTTVGFDDHYCMKYKGYDSRIVVDPATNTYQYPVTGTPYGDFDDFFSVPMDLSAFSGGTCNLDFMYAAAARSSNVADVNDSLEIDYTVNNGTTWKNLVVLSQGALINNGALASEFVPTNILNWSPKTIPLPAAAITNYTTFRFRYLPKVGQDGFSSGNDFYMDRLNFSTLPAGVSNVQLNSVDIAVVPNPTSGDAYVVIKDNTNTTAKVIVTDVTGKVVYTVSQLVIGGEAHILIPHDAIAVAGMYLVQATTGAQSQTKKLVVY